MQQRDRRAETTSQSGAQHAQQRRDATASGEQQHALLRLGPAQLAIRWAQLQHIADRQMLQQVRRNAPTRLMLDRNLQAALRLHRSQTVTAAQAYAITLGIQQACEPAYPGKRNKGHGKTPVNNCSLDWQSIFIQSTVVHSKSTEQARFDASEAHLLECGAD